jgi:cytochrome oxidase assembly protein ShyY1
VFTPARLADGKIVMVNRGFVRERRPQVRVKGSALLT